MGTSSNAAIVGLETRLSTLQPSNVLNVAHNPLSCFRLVHRIKMDAADAPSHEIDNLFDGIGFSRLLQGLRVMLIAVQYPLEFCRDGTAGQLCDAQNLILIQHRHDAGGDGNIDSRQIDFLHKAVEYLVIEKQLRDEEIHALINLFLEMLNILHLVVAFNMLLGIASRSDAETFFGLCFSDQIAGKLIMKGSGKFKSGSSGISPRSANTFSILQPLISSKILRIFLCRGDAGQVRQAFNAVVILIFEAISTVLSFALPPAP